MEFTSSHLTSEQCKKFSGPALIKFMEVCADWQIDNQEELSFAGYPKPEDYTEWCLAAISDRHFYLDERRLLRLASVVGVYEAIAKILPVNTDRVDWLTNPIRGPICRGLSPSEILSDPEDLIVLVFREKIDQWINSPWIRMRQIKRVQQP